MKIEFWLDYLCPFGYMVHKNLEYIIDNYHFDDVELFYRSYEMVPGFDPETDDCSLETLIARHHLLDDDEASNYLSHIKGVHDIRPVSVTDAHRLSHLAKRYGLAFEYNKRIYHTFYCRKQDISRHDVLLEVATDTGLPKKAVLEVLASDLYLDAVSLNRENAIMKGIHEVPHIRINGTIRLPGYQSVDQLLLGINRALLEQSKSEYCVDGNCLRRKAR
ncbi:MAG: DsbA family protein [Acholeplasmataceae bacterium]|nr:DsbA family protein [Acholeplasmataceae bacterium]